MLLAERNLGSHVSSFNPHRVKQLNLRNPNRQVTGLPGVVVGLIVNQALD